MPFHIEGRLEGGHSGSHYKFGDMDSVIDIVRVEDYTPRPVTLVDRLKSELEDLKRRINARSRPTGEENARKLRERGESLDSITFRDAVAADIPALAELHVTTWNATYNTSAGPQLPRVPHNGPRFSRNQTGATSCSSSKTETDG